MASRSQKQNLRSMSIDSSDYAIETGASHASCQSRQHGRQVHYLPQDYDEHEDPYYDETRDDALRNYTPQEALRMKLRKLDGDPGPKSPSKVRYVDDPVNIKPSAADMAETRASFKDRMLGKAIKVTGTMTRNPEMKEKGLLREIGGKDAAYTGTLEPQEKRVLRQNGKNAL